MEDGLQKMKKAFPEDACFLSEMPVLSSVFTGCEMEAGVQAENLTVVETDGKKAVQID